VDDFSQHFTTKVERIRASTSSAQPPVIIDRAVSEPM
jgi:hypothetical protein